MRTNIITHSFNRLEYTVANITETQRLNPDRNYTQIIIEQGSTDGAIDWLKSMEVEGFYPIRVQYNEVNSGDAGGIQQGMAILDDDCEFVIQQNNDLIPETEDYIAKLEKMMDADPKIGAVMLWRNGVGEQIPLIGAPYEVEGIKLYKTQKPVAFYYRRELLDKINFYKTGINIGWVFEIASRIQKLGYGVYKTPDITLMHKDGTFKVSPGGNQLARYGKYFGSRRKDLLAWTNFKDINYKELYKNINK